MEAVHISEVKTEVKIKKILGDKALDVMAGLAKDGLTKENMKKIIEYGSDAKIEELGLREINDLIDKIGKENGLMDFPTAPEEKPGK